MSSFRGRLAYILYIAVVIELSLQGFYFSTAGDFLFKRMAVPVYAPHPSVPFFNKPHFKYIHRTSEYSVTYVTNSQGFRVPHEDVFYSYEKPEDVFRVMLLGPSFAFGWAADYKDAYSTRLKMFLEERSGAEQKKIEVINAGVPGMSTNHSITWYEREGKKFNPDLVILFKYGSMLYEKDHKKYSITPEGFITTDTSHRNKVQSYLKKSAIIFYSWTFFTKVSGAEKQKNKKEVLGAGQNLMLGTQFDPNTERVKLSIDHYKEAAQVIYDSGSKMLLLYFPLSYVVHPSHRGRWQHLGLTDIDESIRFDADFCAFLSQNLGISCLNITDGLVVKAKNSDQLLYYWLDIHWTAEGNKQAALLTAEHLAEALK